MKNKNNCQDRLTWVWKGDGDVANFGDPDLSTDVGLCLYAGTASTLLYEAKIPGGGLCKGGVEPCWMRRSNGFVYRNAKRTTNDPRQIQKILFRINQDGSASLRVKGKGPDLWFPVNMLPLPDPLVVQFVNSTGNCWETALPVAARNTAIRYVSSASNSQ